MKKIVVTAAAAALMLAGCSGTPDSWKPNVPSQTQAQTVAPAPNPPAAPKVEVKLFGDGPAGLTESGTGIVENGTVKLKPNHKVVTVHFDYQCPYCKFFELANADILNELAASGDILLINTVRSFLDRPHKNNVSVTAGTASLCAAEAGKYQNVSKTIFQGYDEKGSGYPKDFFTTQLPTKVGITDLTAWQKCLSDPKKAKTIEAMETLATQEGIVTGTPSVVVNGQRLDVTQEMLRNGAALKQALTG